jgi:hypothetical protein
MFNTDSLTFLLGGGRNVTIGTLKIVGHSVNRDRVLSISIEFHLI